MKKRSIKQLFASIHAKCDAEESAMLNDFALMLKREAEEKAEVWTICSYLEKQRDELRAELALLKSKT